MSPKTFSRRRVLAISAAVGGLGLAAWKQSPLTPTVWLGNALGAQASITLYDDDPARAGRILDMAVAEIARLEKVFSLYRADSALSRLNRDGHLSAPPLDLVRLLGEARRIAAATDGAFDITVQPLWQLYARHFRDPAASPQGPSPQDIEQALTLVDFRGVEAAPGRIGFSRPGMAVTLNGIAQGYITDRVAELMRGQGVGDVLVDLGEIRALGQRHDGTAWRVGIADPLHDGEILETMALRNGALATSAGRGSRFDLAGRHHHLFDPRSGRSSGLYASVSVAAPRTTTADALSTAFSSMRLAEIAASRPQLGDFNGFVVHKDGTKARLG